MEKLKGEKELNSITVYGQDSNKQPGHGEEHSNSLKDECKVHIYFVIYNINIKLYPFKGLELTFIHYFYVVCSF